MVAFFRSLGGTAGVSVMGAVLGSRITTLVVESAYGEAVADVFLIAVPLAVISIIAIALLPAKALGTKTSVEQLQESEAATASLGL